VSEIKSCDSLFEKTGRRDNSQRPQPIIVKHGPVTGKRLRRILGPASAIVSRVAVCLIQNAEPKACGTRTRNFCSFDGCSIRCETHTAQIR
jgi:hypothetical protein